MKIVFSGGGTLGPVTPLLAIADHVRAEFPDADFVWLGTSRGPERTLVDAEHMRFYAIQHGKLRRYLSFLNVVDVIRLGIASVQSLYVLLREKPDMCMTAGGFVSVPVHWAAWMLGVPTWVHQQDVRAGLANKLMAKHATVVTTALKESVTLFPGKHTMWIGNPVRDAITAGDSEVAKKLFALNKKPVVFATGGGTGSLRVNQMVAEMLPHIHAIADVIHLTGKERPRELAERAAKHFPEYHTFQFFTEEMKHAYAVSSVVISRAGFGTLTELAALKKPAVLIPKGGHQEENAAYLAERGAAIVINERSGNGYELAMAIKNLLLRKKEARELGETLGSVLPIATRKDILRVVNLLREHR